MKKDSLSVKRHRVGKRVATVIRENGKIAAYTYEKISPLKAKQRFKEVGTLRKDFQLKRTTLTNVKEIVLLKSSSIQNRKKKLVSKRPDKNAQYVVEGYYKGNYISARSQRIAASYSFITTSQQAKEQAWSNFLARLSEVAGLEYDADEGIKEIDNVTNIREGWVYYTKK